MKITFFAVYLFSFINSKFLHAIQNMYFLEFHCLNRVFVYTRKLYHSSTLLFVSQTSNTNNTFTIADMSSIDNIHQNNAADLRLLQWWDPIRAIRAITLLQSCRITQFLNQKSEIKRVRNTLMMFVLYSESKWVQNMHSRITSKYGIYLQKIHILNRVNSLQFSIVLLCVNILFLMLVYMYLCLYLFIKILYKIFWDIIINIIKMNNGLN